MEILKINIIRPKDLASFFQVSQRTISRMIERGDLPPMTIKRGHRKGWTVEVLVDFLKGQHDIETLLVQEGRAL